MREKTSAGETTIVQYFAAPPAEETPIAGVLRTWQRYEAGRFPLRFGGLTWGDRSPETHSQDLTYEFAAAIDALQQRAWPFELVAEVTGRAIVRVAYAPNRVATATDNDPMAAFIRAAAFALSVQLRSEPTGLPLVLATSFTGLPVTEGGNRPRVTTPVEDLRVWSRLEPHRFDKGATHYSSPLYRGRGGNVLAPAMRAMVVLQYVTAASVFESAGLHGWTTQLAGVVGENGQTLYQAQIDLPDGQAATGEYTTPGPATVKAYLAALRLASNNQISLIPHPKDRFSYSVVAAHTNKTYRYRIVEGKQVRYADATGTFAAFENDLRPDRDGVPNDLVILDRAPTPEEIELAVASGRLPAPWP